jgi:phosphatidylinositol glycan class H protein
MASRRFISMNALEDFFINEGLRRWDVRYYLAAMKTDSDNHLSLTVAYEVGYPCSDFGYPISKASQNLLPHFPILLEVYRGVHETLFDGLEPPEDGGSDS